MVACGSLISELARARRVNASLRDDPELGSLLDLPPARWSSEILIGPLPSALALYSDRWAAEEARGSAASEGIKCWRHIRFAGRGTPCLEQWPG